MTENAARRRIGDILLAHGFASETELAEAGAEQERTGQPLGQILVQHGVITRLELASALAEQWSDQSVGASLLPVPKSAPRPVPHHDDDNQYAARLQDAVADLARRVHATQPSDAPDARVTDLAERIEATVARTQRIEATLAALADNLEGVTGGVEEAFASLQTGMAGVALDLGRIDATVAGIMARATEPTSFDSGLSARLEELAAAVHVLSERPVADDALRGHVDELASRLETLAEDVALDQLREALGEIQAQVALLAGRSAPTEELERHSALLAELKATVSDLEARPVGNTEIDERLERIEAGLADRAAMGHDTAAVETLAARLETAIDREDEVRARVEGLDTRVDEIARLAERDDGTAARIDDLEARLAAGTVAVVELRHELSDLPEPVSRREIEELGNTLDTLRGEVASLRLTEPDDRVDRLADRVEELAADHTGRDVLTARLEALEGRLPSDVVTRDDLSRALDSARGDLLPIIPASDGRVAQLADDLAALSTELTRTRDELAAAPPKPDARIEQLTNDLTAVREELARTRDELGGSTPEPDHRIDLLAHDLDDIRARLTAATPDPQLMSRLEALAGRVEEVAADRGTHEALAAQLQGVEHRLATDVVTSATFEGALSEIRDELARPAVMPPPPAEAEQAAARLEERLAVLESLSTRVDRLAEAVALPSSGEPAAASDDLRHEVDERLEELTRTLDERLAALGSGPAGTAEGPVGIEQELERTRMALERVGLHLGEHDRALGELMRQRGTTQRLDELATRIDELASGGVPGGTAVHPERASGETANEMRSLMRRVEDAEAFAAADREKLMNRLERMASSIDWRLQRLEAGDAE